VQQEKTKVNIGKSVIIKGELSGSEDLTIEGQVEGKIELRQNVLTIGPNAKIKAQVAARAVVVEGHVQGNITTSEKIEIRDKGSVEGDLSSPRVAIADGAHFRGSIDMQHAKSTEKPAADARPAAASSTPSVTAVPAAAAASAAR
jgi:cytoskeletal protein CcmA (bactofilin family)